MLTQPAQFAGLLFIVLSERSHLFAQALQRFVAGVEPFEFLHQLLLQVGQLRGVHSVLARQGIDGIEAFFQGL